MNHKSFIPMYSTSRIPSRSGRFPLLKFSFRAPYPHHNSLASGTCCDDILVRYTFVRDIVNDCIPATWRELFPTIWAGPNVASQHHEMVSGCSEYATTLTSLAVRLCTLSRGRRWFVLRCPLQRCTRTPFERRARQSSPLFTDRVHNLLVFICALSLPALHTS